MTILIMIFLVGCDDFDTDYLLSDSTTEETTVSDFSTPAESTAAKLTFSTIDIDGNTVTEEILSNAKVVMINFWEPWCGPCVGEMPDLEKLYEEYKDAGFLVLGVYSSTDMEDDVREVLKQCETTYPIVRVDRNLAEYMTNYVPTTIFTDGEGTILSDEPMIGSNSYNEWKKVIESYLN